MNNNINISYKCPHCNILVELDKNTFNSKIFRHGIYKNNFKKIDIKLTNLECKLLSQKGLIIGCGKLFQISKNKLIKLDYYFLN